MVADQAQRARLLVNTGGRLGAAVALAAGESLEIVDLRGRQSAVLVAFVATDAGEWLSPAVTRGRLNAIMVQVGDKLYSNLGRPLFEIVADTVGRHDLLLPLYDIEYYDQVHSAPGHDSCRTNLYRAFREWHIRYEAIPDPLTFFANIGIRQRGELDVRRPLSEEGDSIALKALLPLVVGVSASPHDYNLLNDYSPSELLLRVLEGQAES